METNFSLRRYFDDLYLAQKKVARSRACSEIELLNLSSLSPSLRVLKIRQKMDLHQKKMDVFGPREYLDFADDRPHLMNCFLGHLYFCPHHEEEKLLEALVLSETNHLLRELLAEAIAQLPPFTFADFRNNELNVVYYEFNQQPPGTSRQDYAAMRQWQTHMKLECVDLQSNRWIENFIDNGRGLAGDRNLARPEMDQVEFLLQNAPHMTPGDFFTKLAALRAFSPGSMPDDPIQWHESFCQFLNGQILSHAFSPGSLQESFGHIQAGKISNAPLCGWSLMKYKKWLGDLLEGKIDLHEMPECSYEKLFERNSTSDPLKGK